MGSDAWRRVGERGREGERWVVSGACAVRVWRWLSWDELRGALGLTEGYEGAAGGGVRCGDAEEQGGVRC
jgi:hypothetical protein